MQTFNQIKIDISKHHINKIEQQKTSIALKPNQKNIVNQISIILLILDFQKLGIILNKWKIWIIESSIKKEQHRVVRYNIENIYKENIRLRQITI